MISYNKTNRRHAHGHWKDGNPNDRQYFEEAA